MKKVWIQTRNNDTGKARFCRMLSHELKSHSYICSFDEHKADIVLGVSKFKKIVRGAKHVLRVNGVNILDNKESRWRNAKIAKSIYKADAVIWQSKFSKRFGYKLLAKPSCKDYVIHNGSMPDIDLPEYGSRYKKYVVVVGKWSKKKHLIHKRWNETLEIIRTYPNKKVGFLLAGICEHEIPDLPNMEYLGYLEEKQLKTIVANAHCMLNLSCYDACPNAVVDARIYGVPVICNSGDGTEEIATTVINTGRPRPKYISKFQFRKFDVKPFHNAIDKDISQWKRIFDPKIHIEIVAKKYAEVFDCLK